MSKTEEAIVRITGAYPAFTRPPYGSFNDLVLQVAQERGQQLVNWDFVPGDAVNASVAQQERNYDDIVASHPSIILALNHETHESTIHQTLPYGIQKLQAAGYQLVTLAECLGKPAYKYKQAPAARDSTWHC
ncbi:hypothetical protein AX15_005867 [Amanita polypyramis BW_CC]|nr:hypothetical protein AX15_005867 [Amanita polypyramis BW_CC]